MKLEKNAGPWSLTPWAVGAVVLGFGVYKLLKAYAAHEEIDLEPATSPSGAHPYFDAHRRHHPEEYSLKNLGSEHRAHRGNGPGERNQIGGRASGKRARY